MKCAEEILSDWQSDTDNNTDISDGDRESLCDAINAALLDAERSGYERGKAESNRAEYERGMREAAEICKSRVTESDFTIEATRCCHAILSALNKPKDEK